MGIAVCIYMKDPSRDLDDITVVFVRILIWISNVSGKRIKKNNLIKMAYKTRLVF